jgi:hypothetical protein
MNDIRNVLTNCLNKAYKMMEDSSHLNFMSAQFLNGQKCKPV